MDCQVLRVTRRPSTILGAQPGPTPVTLTIHDLRGRRVRTLWTGEQPAGAHTAIWDGRSDRGLAVAAGSYLVRLVAGAGAASHVLSLVRCAAGPRAGPRAKRPAGRPSVAQQRGDAADLAQTRQGVGEVHLAAGALGLAHAGFHQTGRQHVLAAAEFARGRLVRGDVLAVAAADRGQGDLAVDGHGVGTPVGQGEPHITRPGDRQAFAEGFLLDLLPQGTLVYLDHAYRRRKSDGPLAERRDLFAVVREGAGQRLRPVVMTATAVIGGLLPILWGHGAGASVMKRIAAPMVGGMVSATLLTLIVIPVVYSLWREREVRRRVAVQSVATDTAPRDVAEETA